MVARGAGDVGCAHCTVIGADRSCQVCTRLVCESCGADWTTCPEPSGREVRLGRTARLRDVDPSGRIGLVTRWVGSMRLFDVRRLRWVIADLPRHHTIKDQHILERLTPTGELYWNLYLYGSDEAATFRQLQRQSLASGTVTSISGTEPDTHAGMTSDGHYYFVSSTQLVVVVAPDGTVRTFEPMPRRVVHSCFLDVEREVLVSATWGEIVVHRVLGDKLVPITRIGVDGNVSWVALEEPWLAACVGGIVRVWRVGTNYGKDALPGDIQFALGRGVYQQIVGDPLRMASLSRDGRYLAMAVDRKIVLHDLDQGVTTELEGHTDDICLVRFAGIDQLLVTADEDNRVILRPRTPTGYVRTLIEIDVPDEPIALDLATDLTDLLGR